MRHSVAGPALALFTASLLTACSGPATATHDTSAAEPGIPITVAANSCGTGWRSPKTGLQTFQVRNVSSAAVDVTLIDAQTGGVYADLEEVGPGTTRAMQVDVGSGSYAFQCDAASSGQQTGPTVVVPGHVTGGKAVPPPGVQATIAALASDKTYVLTGLSKTGEQAAKLAADLVAGDLTAAKADWLTAHLSFERLGSAYGMFGDYDDEIDGTPNGLPLGPADPAFTGFYRIEYGLWHGQKASELVAPAQNLVHALQALHTAYPGMIRYPQAALSDLALRTHEILEHAIRFQLSGADDFGSGTTLATASANLDAIQAQLQMLRPLLTTSYPDLSSLDRTFARLRTLVHAAQVGGNWMPVSALSDTARTDLNAAAAQTVTLLAPIATMFESSPLP